MSYRLRFKLLELLKKSDTPLNTCQICRIINGVTKNEIKFCRGNIGWEWTDPGGFSKRGNHAYINCVDHAPNWKKVYSQLSVLERKGFLESRLEYRSDPINASRKDRMRMWAYIGRLPRITNFLEMKGSLQKVNADA